MNEYPKVLYNKKGETATVDNPDQEKKLGADWRESPEEFSSSPSSKK